MEWPTPVATVEAAEAVVVEALSTVAAAAYKAVILLHTTAAMEPALHQVEPPRPPVLMVLETQELLDQQAELDL
jgi:hypothetical protein